MNKVEIKLRVLAASAVAPSKSKVLAWREEQVRLCTGFLDDNLTFKEFLEGTRKISSRGQITVSDIDGLHQLLVCLGLPDRVVEHMAHHESLHYDVAKEHELQPEPGIQMVRYGFSPPYVMNAFTKIDFPDDLEPDLAREILRKIIRAPGEDMSYPDKLMVGLLK